MKHKNHELELPIRRTSRRAFKHSKQSREPWLLAYEKPIFRPQGLIPWRIDAHCTVIPRVQTDEDDAATLHRVAGMTGMHV